MKTLSTPITAQATATQSIWCELYDFYLPIDVDIPQYGNGNVIRLCTAGVNINAFTPQFDPEPSGTQGNGALYIAWPITRDKVTGATKFQNNQVAIAVSNVSSDYARMFADIDWDGVAVVVRKFNLAIAAPTADDVAILFNGLVDSAKISLQQFTFYCSNGLGNFQLQLPTENMHTSCRFVFGDDMCGQLRFHPANFKSKTCAASCTPTKILSTDLTEDTFGSDWETSPGSYTDLVDALADASITASSELPAYTTVAVIFESITFGHPFRLFKFSDVTKSLALGQKIQFAAGTMPTGLSAATDYYVVVSNNLYYAVSATLGGSPIYPTTNGATVTLTTSGGFHGYAVKSSNDGFWQMNPTDWGTAVEGYWQIPDAQAGISNPALTPYLQFDFGSAQTINLWQVSSINGSREQLVKLIEVFSSTDNATWKFETYFEMPPVPDTLFDVHIPTAQSAQYWRICVRTRWAETGRSELLATVKAYANSKNYWMGGFVQFDPNTTTPELRNLSAPILASYAGELDVCQLPIAPAAGDIFTIERGCNRSFNNCSIHRNTENHGGFNSMPFQTVIQ